MAEREALAAVIPPDPGYHYHQAEGRVRRLEHQLEALDKADGWGVLGDTAVGEAAIAWRQALGEWQRCSAQAQHGGLRERHQLHRQADRAAAREGPWRERFEALAAPERARIRAELPEARRLLAELEGHYYGHLHFQIAHPEALRRLERLDHQIASVAYELDVERQDLDGISPLRPELPPPARAWWREAPTLERGIERDVRVPERGIEIEL